MEEIELENLNDETKKRRMKMKISLFTLFKTKEVLFAVLTMFVGTFNIQFFTAWLENDVKDHGWKESYTGYIMASQSLVYLAGCLLLPYTCESAARRFQFVFAIVGFGFTMFLLGPTKIFPIPDNIWYISSAFPFLGLFQIFVFIPIIPEMIERLQVSLNISEGEDEYVDAMVTDKCNDCYGLFYALSMFISPIIGS